MSQPIPEVSAGFLQFDVRPGDISVNLGNVTERLADLRPESPGIILLPEMWATGFSYQELPALARQTPELLETLTGLAAEYQIIIAGSLPEPAPDNIEKIYNTLYVIGPNGVIGAFRKQHLFAPMQEDLYLTPGTGLKPLDTSLGRIAGLVCYDLRFPELLRMQTAQGATLLLVAAEWPMIRKDHWRTLLLARAIENQIFVIAANRCGRDALTDDNGYAGNSMIIAPDGSILHEAGSSEESVSLQIDMAAVDIVRGRFNTAQPNTNSESEL